MGRVAIFVRWEGYVCGEGRETTESSIMWFDQQIDIDHYAVQKNVRGCNCYA